MAPKNKVKMDLGSFLADETFGGSWADDEFDMNTLEVSTGAQKGPSSRFGGSGGFGGSNNDYDERREFPIPNEPPYTARVNNLPRDILDDDVQAFFADNLQILDPFEEFTDFYAPKDQVTGSLKGFAFISFKNRKTLEDALKLSQSNLGGRTVYVSVAAPNRDSQFSRGPRGAEPDLDWNSIRDGSQPQIRNDRFERRSDRAPMAEPDWGSARNGEAVPEVRHDRFPPRREPRERAPEPDWGSARDTEEVAEVRGDRFPPRREPREPREPRERRPEPDWTSARETEEVPEVRRDRFVPRREPRERKPEPEFNWESARETQLPIEPKPFKREPREPRESVRKPKPAKDEPDFDWDNLRGSALGGPRSPATRTKRSSKSEPKDSKTTTTTDAPKKSVFSVLADEDESSEPAEKESKQVENLVASTEKLSVEDDGWNVVSKK